MDLAIIAENGTMNSREIARLTGKQHGHVLRGIEEQLGQLEGGVSRFESSYQKDTPDLDSGLTTGISGRSYKCYMLPKRECLILASGYDVVLRAKIIDRWAELEKLGVLAL